MKKFSLYAAVFGCAIALVMGFAAPSAFAFGGNVENPGGPDGHLRGPAINGELYALQYLDDSDPTEQPVKMIWGTIEGACGGSPVTVPITGRATSFGVTGDYEFEDVTRDDLVGVFLGYIPPECGYPADALNITIISARKVIHGETDGATCPDGQLCPDLSASVTVLSVVPK